MGPEHEFVDYGALEPKKNPLSVPTLDDPYAYLREGGGEDGQTGDVGLDSIASYDSFGDMAKGAKDSFGKMSAQVSRDARAFHNKAHPLGKLMMMVTPFRSVLAMGKSCSEEGAC